MTPILLSLVLQTQPKVWSGPHSKAVKSETRLISNQQQWEKTWALAGRSAPAPTVDFRKSFVVARFGGKLRGVEGYGVEKKPDFPYVGIRVIPQWVQTIGNSPKLDREPYGLFVLPRSHVRRVIVMEAVPGLKSDKGYAFKQLMSGWLPA